VILNVAASVDGKIDTFQRRGAAISSQRDRERVDALRASVDAVMVGGHTVVDEDPRLTVKSAELRADRQARGLPANPAKVAVTSSLLRLNPKGRFVTAGPARVIVFIAATTPASMRATLPEGQADAASAAPARLGEEMADAASAVPARLGEEMAETAPAPPATHREEMADAASAAPATLSEEMAYEASESTRAALAQAGVEVFAIGEGRVDLCAAMTTLYGQGMRRLLVEGGGSLNFELLRLGLVDEVHVFVAPLVFGGASAPTLADGAGLARAAAIRLTQTEVDVDDDGGVVLRYKVEPRE